MNAARVYGKTARREGGDLIACATAMGVAAVNDVRAATVHFGTKYRKPGEKRPRKDREKPGPEDRERPGKTGKADFPG